MKKRFLLFILLLPVLSMMGCSDSDSNSSTPPLDRFVRSTQFGMVSGVSFTNDTMAWLGIPYAKPPTKANGLRWKAPQDPEPWEGVLPSLEARWV